MSGEATGFAGDSTPLGTTLAEGSTGGTAPETNQETPTAFDLNDDTLVRVKGSDKPVKYGEHFRGFQSQFTKASQEASRLRKELEAERSARAQFEQERQRSASTQQAPQGQDLMSKLKEMPYLSGEAAAEMVSGIVQQFQSRDQALQILVKKVIEQDKILGGLHAQSSTQSFDQRIHQTLTDLGYDPKNEGVRELAKEVYLAYEGDDLPNEFPRIFGERMKQVEEFFETKRRMAIQNARRTPFVPGQGGQASPSKPLQLDPHNSARQDAEALWDALQVGDRT